MRRIIGWIGVWAGAGSLGWSFAALLGDLSPASPAVCALVAAGAASLWAAAAELRGMGEAFPYPLWAGLAGPGVVLLSKTFPGAFSGISFERVGLIWIFGEWGKVDARTYLFLALLGALLVPICLAWLYLSRKDGEKLVFAGVTVILLAAFWRTVIHPPSGDEPSLLLSAWHFWSTGSLDVTSALGTPAETWSRAADFRDTIILDHTVGRAGGPRYTYHGIVVPALLGVFLGVAGRAGAFAAYCAAAVLAVNLTARAGEKMLGRRASPEWLLAMLAGSPLMVYSVFMSADLWGAALFSLGLLGLVSRRGWMLAVSVAILPWFHHKFFFTAAGLVLASWGISPRIFAATAAAFLCSFIPEAIVLGGALGIPLWPPLEIFSRHAEYGAAYSAAVALNSAPGLLVDRYVGLVYYPAWILGIAGLAWIFLKRAPGARPAILSAVPYVAFILFFNMWAGGGGAPGRMLVMVFPVIALGLFVLEDRLRTNLSRNLVKTAVWIGVFHALAATLIPPLAFESAKKKMEAAMTFSAGFNPLAILPALSSGVQGRLPDALTLSWAAALFTAWILLARSLSAPRRLG